MSGEQIICNKCGRRLRMENDLLVEDAFFAVKEWGYFSRRDLETDSFVICEECYGEWIQSFKKPVTTVTRTEVLASGQTK